MPIGSDWFMRNVLDPLFPELEPLRKTRRVLIDAEINQPVVITVEVFAELPNGKFGPVERKQFHVKDMNCTLIPTLGHLIEVTQEKP